MKKTDTTSYDILGISTATICLAHCIIFPLITIIPFGLDENIWVDVVFACIATCIVTKIVLGNNQKLVKIILGTSVLIVWTSIILDLVYHFHSNIIIAGSVGMITGHILNYKSHQH
ncbi:MAG TPA: MerC domain-containing protein [Flavobacterium sp.]|jgi:ribonuclease PH